MKNQILVLVMASSLFLGGCAKKIQEDEIIADSSDEEQVDNGYGTESTDSDFDELNEADSTYIEAAYEDSSDHLNTYSYYSSDEDQSDQSNYSSHSYKGNSNCVGSDTFYTCHDLQSGNTYQVNKYGNTTHVNGSNATTGANWSQSTNTYGSTSYTNGYDKEGNTWNQTTNHYGDDSYSYHGTDSDGETFGGTCNYGSCSTY